MFLFPGSARGRLRVEGVSLMSTSTVSRIVAVITACISSTLAFFVITRSGVAGTIVGAAVAGLVYGTTSQWVNAGIEKAKSLKPHEEVDSGEGTVPGKAAHATPVGDAQEETGATRPATAAGFQTAVDSGTAIEPGGVGLQKGSAAQGQDLARGRQGRRGFGWLESARSWVPSRTKMLRAWIPAALGVVALLLSALALAGGEEPTRIIKERVVEKPVVQERVIVTHETVEVPVYVAGASSGRSVTTGGDGSEGGAVVGTETTGTSETAPSSTSTSTPTASTTTPTTAAPETVSPTSSSIEAP